MMFLNSGKIRAMDMVWTALRIVGISAGIYLLIAVGLVLTQWPKGQVAGDGLDFSKLGVPEQEQVEAQTYLARDGAELIVRVYGDSGPLVVFSHGSGAFGAAYGWMGRELAARGMQVVLPDLRGHGENIGARGDVAYVGQLEDDLADLIAAFRKDGQKVVLGGHSSGGGLGIRFAGGSHGDMLDGAIFLAPFLKYNAPTSRLNSGGWAQPLTRRLIGLSMLNMVGITALNQMVVIEFNMPEGAVAEGMTDAYSYRLNTSYAPRNNYLKDVAGLPLFLLVVGAEDEAFIASAYEPVMSAVTDRGQYHILDGVSHLDVFLQARTVDLMAAFVNGLE